MHADNEDRADQSIYNATVAQPDLLLVAYLIDAGHEIINGVMVLFNQSTPVRGSHFKHDFFSCI